MSCRVTPSRFVIMAGPEMGSIPQVILSASSLGSMLPHAHAIDIGDPTRQRYSHLHRYLVFRASHPGALEPRHDVSVDPSQSDPKGQRYPPLSPATNYQGGYSGIGGCRMDTLEGIFNPDSSANTSRD